MKLAEFAVEALSTVANETPTDFFSDTSREGDCQDLVTALCVILERKQPRMVKHAKPALLKIKKDLGDDMARVKRFAVEGFVREENR